MQSRPHTKQLLHGNALKMRLFKNINGLLPMPEAILKAQTILTNPNSSFEELAKIIETDHEITLKILNVVNSAYYSPGKEVSSVRQACVMLGLKVIAEIIMAAGTSNIFNRTLSAYRMSPKGLWRHSLATALGSRKIAKAVHPAAANEAFLSGLFHDVGKLILDEQIFSRNDAFVNYLGDTNLHFEAEKKILGFDHSAVASELCKRWKFPPSVTKAIRLHHNINPHQVDDLTYILHAADNLTKMSDAANSGGCTRNFLADPVLDFLALDDDDIQDIMVEVDESVSQISTEIFGTA